MIDLLEQKLREVAANPPWEYYGTYDSQRCFFCGTNHYDGEADEDHHKVDCLWWLLKTERLSLRALLIAQAAQLAQVERERNYARHAQGLAVDALSGMIAKSAAQAAQLETERQENETLKKELLARVDRQPDTTAALPQPPTGDR